ncbi:protease HtpX [Candidatus Woesearchaeota archaeon]|nr:MAG: protease HtpX [Candidatus Woesearchaeota archaeon]HDM43804.1 protease HtpX [Candidatus Woesearchaeota archaeon]
MMFISQFKTAVLLAGLSAILLFLGYVIGSYNGLTVALFIAIVFNIITYFFSDKIVLAMYRAKPLKDESIKELIRSVASKAKIPMPKPYIIPTMTPNAFATGRNPRHAAIALTEGIISLLSKEELKGVIAHEIAHIKNRDILIQTVAATIATAISYIAFMLRFAAFAGSRDRDAGNAIALLALGILTPIIAMIIQLAISRAREYLADETGARIIRNPTALANALMKLEQANKLHPMHGNPTTSSLFIVNPFSARGLFTLFMTHPPIQKRIERLKRIKI